MNNGLPPPESYYSRLLPSSLSEENPPSPRVGYPKIRMVVLAVVVVTHLVTCESVSRSRNISSDIRTFVLFIVPGTRQYPRLSPTRSLFSTEHGDLVTIATLNSHNKQWNSVENT